MPTWLLGGVQHLRNYAVLYVFSVGFVVATAIAPTVSTRVAGTGSNGGSGSTAQAGADPNAVVASPGALASPSPLSGLTGLGGAIGGLVNGRPVPPGAIANTSDVTAIARGLRPGYGTTIAGVSCNPGVRQVADISYAPPCVPHFVGNNGGKTYHGVDDKNINLCFREFTDSGTQAGQALQVGLSGEPISQVESTIDTFVKYFNDHYDFYGRKINLIRHTAKGAYGDETTGGGQDNARADAIECHDSLNGFAELGVAAESEIYVDQLRPLGVPTIAGPVYDPTPYFDSRAPYAWDMGIDCDYVADYEANFIGKQLGKGVAKHAGDATFQVTPRKYGLMVPDLASYSHCGDLTEKYLKERYGITLTLRINYSLNISTASQQTQDYVAKFQAAGVTSLIMLTDDISPAFMTQQADKANWRPEWIISGISNIDVDAIGRVYTQDQWIHAIGPSLLTIKAQNKTTTDGHAAYVSESSDGKYAYSAEGYFRALNAFANMVQMAGPNLTPSTMEQGYFYFPPTSGEYGLLYFGPHNHFNTHDVRDVYWSATAIGADGQPGSYVDVTPGKRYRADTWPSGDPFP